MSLNAIKVLTSQTNSAVASMALANVDPTNATAASEASSMASSAAVLANTAQTKGEAASDVARSAQSSTVVADSKAESAVTLLALRASSAQSSAAVADSKAESATLIVSKTKSYMTEISSRVTAGSAVGSAVSVAIASGGTEFKFISQMISNISSGTAKVI